MDPTHQLRLPVYPAIEKAKQLFWRRKLSSEDQQESEILIASASEQAQHVVKQLESDLAQDLEEYEKKMTLWWRDLQESYQKVVSCVEESVGAGCSDMVSSRDGAVAFLLSSDRNQNPMRKFKRRWLRILHRVLKRLRHGLFLVLKRRRFNNQQIVISMHQSFNFQSESICIVVCTKIRSIFYM